MIAHSEFARRLMSEGEMIRPGTAIRLSADGVYPEGGDRFGEEDQVNIKDQLHKAFNGPQLIEVGGVQMIQPPYLAHGLDSGFKFGKKSQAELKGVLPMLVQVTTLALKYSAQDFMAYDGLRTEAEQAAYVRAGTSQTMNSKHRKQPDGFGHAVDAVPVVGTFPKWDWNLIYPIAAAMDYAATELGVANHIRWGGAWDRTLADFGGDPSKYRLECEAYARRHPGKDFIDGPHFEWV